MKGHSTRFLKNKRDDMSPLKIKYYRLFFFLIMPAALLTGCISRSQIPGQTTPISSTDFIPSITPLLPNENIRDMATQTESGSPSATPIDSTNLAQAHDDNTLQLTFPMAGPEPVSLWRPPLYQTPWALAPFDHFYFVRPIAADEVNWPLANYRYGGIFFGDEVHTGVDIPAPRGTPILAAAAGKVIWAGYGLYSGNDNPDDPYGLAVTIAHDFSYHGKRLYTIYAHMDRIDVLTGQQVEAGDQLGIVGTTGNTTGPHLHFEVRIENNDFYATRNPELWLAPPQGWGVLVGDLRNTNGSFLTEQVVKISSQETGQTWEVISYGKSTVNRDDYYQENLVLSDLPAGDYEIKIDYLEETYSCIITIHPGAISYFKFRGENGYKFQLPSIPLLADWQSSTDLEASNP
jgi:murein DD-endopeptidase MepM/ murein hydrolase activator NlpD